MSLKINHAIYYILSHDQNVLNIAGIDKMFPVVSDEGIKNPFLVYERVNIDPEYTKDGLCSDNVKVQITCVSDSYSEVLNLAEAVRNALELKSGTFAGVKILQCFFENGNEDFGLDNYIQALFFNITTIK